MKPREIQRIMVVTHATGAAWQVLVALAVHARDESREAWPSLPTLVDETHMHRKSVQRAIDRLLELGEIQIVEPASRGRSTTYYVCPVANIVDLDRAAEGRPKEATDGRLNAHTATNGPGGVAVDARGATVGPERATQSPESGDQRTPQPVGNRQAEPAANPQSNRARDKEPVPQSCPLVPGCSFTGAYADHLEVHRLRRPPGDRWRARPPVASQDAPIAATG